MPANADGGRFLKYDSGQAVRGFGGRQHLQQVSRTALLHLDGNRKDVESAGSQQFLSHVAEILGRHIVDVGLDHDDLPGCRLYCCCPLLPKHQTEAVRKIRKLLRTRAVTDFFNAHFGKLPELHG